MSKYHKPKYEPTQEEIEAATVEIRAGWDKKTKCRRMFDDRGKPRHWTAPVYKIYYRPGAVNSIVCEEVG